MLVIYLCFLGVHRLLADDVLSASAPSNRFGDRHLLVKRTPAMKMVSEANKIAVEDSREKEKIMHLDEEMLGQYHDEAISLTILREDESKKQVKCLKNWVNVHKSEWS